MMRLREHIDHPDPLENVSVLFECGKISDKGCRITGDIDDPARTKSHDIRNRINAPLTRRIKEDHIELLSVFSKLSCAGNSRTFLKPAIGKPGSGSILLRTPDRGPLQIHADNLTGGTRQGQ